MYAGPVIDCDVHHGPRSLDEIAAYLDKGWRERLATLPDGRVRRVKPRPKAMFDVNATSRLGSAPPAGGPPGSDYETLRAQALDPFPSITRVHLNALTFYTAMPDYELGHALCRAENDWCVERWFQETGDERLTATLIVPTHVPERGAEEIRRAGRHPQFASAEIAFHPFGRPIGHELYHPIYAAAAEMDLPIFIHVVPGEFLGTTAPLISGGADGSKQYKFEGYLYFGQVVGAHLASMIVNGVFERFPSLRVLVAETGVGWLPSFAAQMEANWELMRLESRWVRKRPTDYLRDHVCFSTQPFEGTPENRSRFAEYLSLVEGVEEMLCFASDYPHWDTDVPRYVQGVLPGAWHEKVFHRNAERALRLAP
jgi:uncharacterized protein